MDRATFQQAMSYLAAAYDAELTPERAAVYWDQLGGLRDEPFLRACRVLVGHTERFPSVSQIREQYQTELRRLSLAQRPRLEAPPDPERKSGSQPVRVASLIADIRRRLGPTRGSRS